MLAEENCYKKKKKNIIKNFMRIIKKQTSFQKWLLICYTTLLFSFIKNLIKKFLIFWNSEKLVYTKNLLSIKLFIFPIDSFYLKFKEKNVFIFLL